VAGLLAHDYLGPRNVRGTSVFKVAGKMLALSQLGSDSNVDRANRLAVEPRVEEPRAKLA